MYVLLSLPFYVTSYSLSLEIFLFSQILSARLTSKTMVVPFPFVCVGVFNESAVAAMTHCLLTTMLENFSVHLFLFGVGIGISKCRCSDII